MGAGFSVQISVLASNARSTNEDCQWLSARKGSWPNRYTLAVPRRASHRGGPGSAVAARIDCGIATQAAKARSRSRRFVSFILPSDYTFLKMREMPNASQTVPTMLAAQLLPFC